MVERVRVGLLTDTYYKVSIDASFGTGSSDELLYGNFAVHANSCLLYTSPSPRDLSTSRMPSVVTPAVLFACPRA